MIALTPLRLTVIAVLCLLVSQTSSAQKYSYTNGNWNNDCTWDVLCGVLYTAPTATDDVVIYTGDDVTVTANAECASLEINDAASNPSTLVINSGVTLTVHGDLVIKNDNYTLNGDIFNSVKAAIGVYGTLIVEGDIIFDNGSHYIGLNVYISQGKIEVGSSLYSGTLTVDGSIRMTNEESHASTLFNEFVLFKGTLNVGDSLIMGDPLLSTSTAVNNFVIYDGFSGNKTINLSGANAIVNYQGNTNIHTPTTNQADCIFNYLQTGNAVLNTTAGLQYGAVNFPNADTITLSANTSANQILGSVTISSGQVLEINDAAVNFDNTASATNFNLNLQAGSTLLLKDAAIENGIPANKVTANSSSTIVYQNNTGTTYDIFLEALNGTSTEYPTVVLNGTGVKYLSSSSNAVNNSTFKVGHITVEEGTLAIALGSELVLNNSYGDKTLEVQSGATVQVEGDFFSAGDFYGDFDRNSIWEYNRNNNSQEVYSITSDGTTPEPYGILKMSTASGSNVVRNVNTEVFVANNLQLGENINFTINNGAYLHTTSDASYTAYVQEIPNSASVTYIGTGAFIVDKHLFFSGYSAPDISTAMQLQNLSMINNAGIQMRGFEGSDKPGNKYSSVSTYTESDTGNVNKGFAKPSNISDIIVNRNGSNKIDRAAYRINVNPGTYTLRDTGEINLKEQTFVLTFNHDNNNDESYRNSADGYNLVGNPFPAPLNWNAIVNDPDNAAIFSGGVSPIIYIYKYFDRVAQEPGGNGGYGYYNPVTTDEFAQDSIIPAHQGFWLKAYDASGTALSYDLVIKESHKLNYEGSLNYKSKGEVAGKKGRKLPKGLIKFAKEDGTQTDEVFFHFFKDASIYYDTRFDVPRFGTPSSKSAFIDFADTTGLALGLQVNAFEDNLIGLEIPLYLNMPSAGNYRLSFHDITALVSSYACISVIDTITGETYALSDDVEIPVQNNEPFAGVRFILRFEKNNKDFLQVNTIDCHNNKNGSITLPLNGLKDNHHYTLWKDGFITKELKGDIDELSFQNLSAGHYELVNIKQTSTCEISVEEITLKNPEKLIASVQLSASTLTQGESVAVNITGNPSSLYQTSVEDMVYTTPDFTHQFNYAGTYTVDILASNADETCIENQQFTVDVEEQTYTSIKENNAGVNYRIENGNIALEKASTVAIYSLDGKLMEQVSDTQQVKLRKGTFLYHLVGVKETTVLKINQ